MKIIKSDHHDENDEEFIRKIEKIGSIETLVKLIQNMNENKKLMAELVQRVEKLEN